MLSKVDGHGSQRLGRDGRTPFETTSRWVRRSRRSKLRLSRRNLGRWREGRTGGSLHLSLASPSLFELDADLRLFRSFLLDRSFNPDVRSFSSQLFVSSESDSNSSLPLFLFPLRLPKAALDMSARRNVEDHHRRRRRRRSLSPTGLEVAGSQIHSRTSRRNRRSSPCLGSSRERDLLLREDPSRRKEGSAASERWTRTPSTEEEKEIRTRLVRRDRRLSHRGTRRLLPSPPPKDHLLDLSLSLHHSSSLLLNLLPLRVSRPSQVPPSLHFPRQWIEQSLPPLHHPSSTCPSPPPASIPSIQLSPFTPQLPLPSQPTLLSSHPLRPQPPTPPSNRGTRLHRECPPASRERRTRPATSSDSRLPQDQHLPTPTSTSTHPSNHSSNYRPSSRVSRRNSNSTTPPTHSTHPPRSTSTTLPHRTKRKLRSSLLD